MQELGLFRRGSVNYPKMAILPKPHIEGIQSVTTFKVTEPRVTQRVDPGPLSSFQRCFNTVLYFKRVEGDDFSGWDLAGWIKDSLGKAFVEEPTICGRLRRPEEGSEFEIVSNDSGARLIEARIGIGLEEFLESEGREEAEAELVYWKDIDEQNPQFCPLFYIQVTNFQCGGYSIGISCSLLLADPPFISSFLKKWAAIHSSLVSEMDPQVKKPIFYLHSVRNINPSSPSPLGPSPCKNSARTVIFKSVDRTVNLDKKSLALLCAEVAEKVMDAKLGSKVSLLVREKSGEVKVEIFSRNNGSPQLRLGPKGQPSPVSWESFEAGEVAFRKGNFPVLVSQWIGTSDGFVMITPYGGEDEHWAYVLVTL
ncbi:stemmadenine O-acetyltransferase [Punica granatum]|uniref:Stemmadenine O-acetyltransferase n=2 Tax=Punica granatum TaxID=22663 RepID=A0A6P8DZT8_PUNGR|nr:stemmadenine O-acetyltransferase [Punica granatum]